MSSDVRYYVWSLHSGSSINLCTHPSFFKVPDYLDIIRHPMDFGTMRRKVEGNEYTNLDQFEKDFYHVWHNATIYNQKDTIYYRAAVRIKEAGKSTVCMILSESDWLFCLLRDLI